MNIIFEPILIDLDSPTEREGLLVWGRGHLLGILVRLAGRYENAALPGSLFLEAGFGKFASRDQVFRTMATARAWFQRRSGEDE